MIISCPQCSSEFVLHLDKLPPAKFLQGHGFGWVMACSNCKHRWWHKKKEQPAPPPSHTEMSIAPISDDFEDLTNLEGLKRIITRTQMPTEEVLAKSAAFYQPAGREAPLPPPSYNQEPVLDLEGRRLKPNPRSSKPRLSKTLIGFWMLFLFLIGILMGALFIYKDRLPNVWGQPSKPVKKASAKVTPLVLQNVKYVSQSSGAGRNYLNVMGEIVNNNSLAIALHPIKIVVWSHCPANTETAPPPANAAATPPAQPTANCIKADWAHAWERPHILPGERLWFQTGTSLPADVKIERVDVTLP